MVELTTVSPAWLLCIPAELHGGADHCKSCMATLHTLMPWGGGGGGGGGLNHMVELTTVSPASLATLHAIMP